MKVIFFPAGGRDVTICSICEDAELVGGLMDWREKFGPEVSFYALDCPDLHIKVRDYVDNADAIMDDASQRVIAALNRGGRGESIPELMSLDQMEYDLRGSEEARGEPMLALPTELDIAPVKYVIFQSAQEDFLAGVEDATNNGKEYERTKWDVWPGNALGFDTPEEAEKKARSLVNYYGYTLAVCALHETEEKYWKELVKEISPVDPSFN